MPANDPELPWGRLEVVLAPKFAHEQRVAKLASGTDLLGKNEREFGGGVSNAVRPHLSIRLMTRLLYLENSLNQLIV